MSMKSSKRSIMYAFCAAFAVAICSASPSFAAADPAKAMSDGTNLVSAGSDAPSGDTVALETRYRTSERSNFIDMLTEKLRLFFIVVR